MHKAFSDFLIHTPILVWMVITITALFIEAVVAGGQNQPIKSTLLNICNAFLLCTSSFLITPLTTFVSYKAANQFGSGFIDLRLFTKFAIISQVTSGLLYLFFYDLLFYFWHRAEHRISFLWHIHAFHHSDSSFNATSYLRQHWLEIPIQNIVISIPLMLLFRFTPVTLFAVAFVMAAHVFFTHMNIKLQMGRYSCVATGPQLHRLHHSCLPEHWDKNYAQIFPIIDVMFGTYVAPKKNEFPPTGLSSQERMQALHTIFMWPFMQWFRSIRQ